MKPGFTIRPADLPAIAAFECVARRGSFTRAADELGLSTSALSQQVRKLEAALDLQLLRRTTRRVSPTDAGARLLAAATASLASLADAVDGLADEGEQPRGAVRVALSRVAYTLLIAPHLPGFRRAFPEVQLEFGLSDGLSEIVGEGYDLGVRLGERLPRDMVATPLGGPQRLAVVGSPAYFAAHPRPTTPHDLLAHDCIRLRFVTSGRINPWTLDSDAGELELAVRGSLVLSDMVETLAAAVAGLGLAQVFEGLARPDLAAKRLVRVLPAYAAPFPGFSAYYPSRAHLPARVRAFLEFFRKATKTRPG